MALISLDNVSKIYPKGTRPALDDINLDIERGDFVFLVGASGSGKTTLLSLLLREEEATSGEIRVAGNDLRRITNRQVPQYRRSLGFVFQDYKLLNNKTVWENVAFALEVIGTRRSTIKSLVPKVLNTVGLTGKEKNYPHELSGGEQQRVAIARAYVNHPQILLADEPTGNLDPTTSLGIMEVLDAINRTGTTIVMATHNEEIVNSMRKRVVELHNGKIVRDEAHGSYDSALFFPDAEVEAKSDTAHHVLAAATKAIEGSDEPSEGIARLANSVHSGRTGRYGETFAPLEDTLTWGKGIPLDEQAAALESTQAFDPFKDESAATAATSTDTPGGKPFPATASSVISPENASTREISGWTVRRSATAASRTSVRLGMVNPQMSFYDAHDRPLPVVRDVAVALEQVRAGRDADCVSGRRPVELHAFVIGAGETDLPLVRPPADAPEVQFHGPRRPLDGRAELVGRSVGKVRPDNHAVRRHLDRDALLEPPFPLQNRVGVALPLPHGRGLQRLPRFALGRAFGLEPLPDAHEQGHADLAEDARFFGLEALQPRREGQGDGSIRGLDADHAQNPLRLSGLNIRLGTSSRTPPEASVFAVGTPSA